MKENTVQAKNVIRWLKTQPVTKRFNYFHNNACLFASYAKDMLRVKNERVSCRSVLLFVGRTRYTIPFRTEAAISNLNSIFTVKDALAALRKV